MMLAAWRPCLHQIHAQAVFCDCFGSSADRKELMNEFILHYLL